MSNKKIAIIGDGGWGTTLAILLSHKGYNIIQWSAFPVYAELVAKERESTRYMPGVKIPDEVIVTGDRRRCKGSELFILAVPCQYLREVLTSFKDIIDHPVVSVVKGIENETLKRPSEIVHQILPRIKYAELSGPTIAYEVAREIPTTCVIASSDVGYAKELQDVFSTERFRTYTSDDVIGVELGGALKNVIAIAAGIADGMGFGVNTKSAILTRGLVEIARLGKAVGARKDTFHGLSGVGDLATTCMSEHSRNRWFGEEIGKGKRMNEVIASTKMVVEGIATTKSAYALAKKYEVEMPITEQIYQVLYEEKMPSIAVKELMTRAKKGE